MRTRIEMKRWPIYAVGILLLAWPPVPAAAETIEIPDEQVDDVTAEITAGLQAYLEGDYPDAKAALEFAVQMIGDIKAGGLTALLPQPIGDEWTMSEPDTTAAGAVMFGGGISANAEYSNGSETCTVTITGDSPMLQAVSMMFNNPAILGASGAKMKRVGTERVIITQDGDVQAMAGTYFVQYGGDCSEENKLAYVAATDFDAIRDYQ